MSNSINSHLLAPQYFKGLRENGYDVYGTFFTDIVGAFLNKSIINRFIFKVFPKYIYNKCNVQLIKDCEEIKPDVLCIFKGMEIYPSTLKEIKNKGIKLANYNLDHPFNYVGKGSGNKNVLDSIELYDLHISYSQYIIKELSQKFSKIKTAYLPFGHHDYVDKLKFEDREEDAVCFIGYGDKERAKKIKIILKEGFIVHLYGPKWDKYLNKKEHHNLRIFDGVFGMDYWRTIKLYRIQLNILREHNVNSHNMRTFEIPAVGGIMLSEYTDEQESFFKNGKEAFYYKSEKELIYIISKLLNMSQTESKEIRINARNRSIQSRYSYINRSQEFYKILNKV